MPIVYVVAGPSGSGKTSGFPGSRFGCDFFNADDYAAHLNSGSYVGIPKSIRAIVGPICEKFIQDHIAASRRLCHRNNSAQHNRLRQMEQAHEAGFDVEFTLCVRRQYFQVHRPCGEQSRYWADIAVPRIRSATFGQEALATFPVCSTSWENNRSPRYLRQFRVGSAAEAGRVVPGTRRLLFSTPNFRHGWMKRWGRLRTRL